MAQLKWDLLRPGMTEAHLGFLPSFLNPANPAAASDQLNAGYKPYGGWRPQRGFKLTASDCLTYPGDPPMRPVAKTKLRDETIYLYPQSFVAVIQPDRSFEVCRMD